MSCHLPPRRTSSPETPRPIPDRSPLPPETRSRWVSSFRFETGPPRGTPSQLRTAPATRRPPEDGAHRRVDPGAVAPADDPPRRRITRVLNGPTDPHASARRRAARSRPPLPRVTARSPRRPHDAVRHASRSHPRPRGATTMAPGVHRTRRRAPHVPWCMNSPDRPPFKTAESQYHAVRASLGTHSGRPVSARADPPARHAESPRRPGFPTTAPPSPSPPRSTPTTNLAHVRSRSRSPRGPPGVATASSPVDAAATIPPRGNVRNTVVQGNPCPATTPSTV